MSRSSARRLGAMVLALLLVWAGWRWARPQAATAPERGIPEPAVPAVAAPAASTAPHPQRHITTDVPPPNPRAELAQRMKADWCGFGAAEHDRQIQAVFDKAAASTGTVGGDEVAELRETVAGRLMEEAEAEVRRRWVAALVQRGDVRSLAVADYLEGGKVGDASTAARARLQARARTSGDPMVTALALLRPCAGDACINIEASQWSRLEPANLQAWLAMVSGAAGAARQTHASYVLDRLAQEAQFSRNYQRELLALLQSLPQTDTPGLQNEAEIQLLEGIAGAWPMSMMRPVLDLCRGGLMEPGTASQCEAVARLLWRQDDLLNRAFGLGIARSLVAARPALRQQWEAQALEYEAVSEWSSGAAIRAAERLVQQSTESRCGWQPEMRRMQQDHLSLTEWDRLRAGMPEARADQAALSTRWRERERRSVLDPLPAHRPASAPATGG